MTALNVRRANGVVFGCLLVALPAWLACGQSDAPTTTGFGSGFGTTSSSGASEAGSPAPAAGGAPLPAEGSDTGANSSGSGATLGSDAGSMAGDSPGGGPGAPSCAAKGESSTAHQPGYVGDWVPGNYPPTFDVDAGLLGSNTYLTISGVSGQQGNARQYAVHVPAGYQGTPVPAVFCIHGLTETASFCGYAGVDWPGKGDHENFVVIMPNGYQNSWNAGTCCGAAASAGLDDVALMRAIFAEVGTHVNIDLGRVYATGFSNGGYMSYRLGCEASDLFVAVAPAEGAVGTAAIGGGTMPTSDLKACNPTHRISVLDIHGTSDSLVAYAAQAPSVASFQAANGCSTTQQAASVTPSGGDTTCVSFTGCPSCPNVEVTSCTIQGGGHCWYGSSDCGTGAGPLGAGIVGNNSNFMKDTDAIWRFFAQHSR